MKNRAFTLIEFIIAVSLVGLVLLSIIAGSTFFTRRINDNLERYNIYSQINYALDDMKLRVISAINFNPQFNTGETKHNLRFWGENNIYNITPDTTTDNAWYEYRTEIDPSDPQLRNRLVVENEDTGDIEVLVDFRYNPQITFEHVCNPGRCFEPNFITVTINATGEKNPDLEVQKSEGLRSWFVDFAS